VAVSIFVNPTQFGPGEDLSRYPRDLDRDLKICATSGASFVFAPRAPVELYPPGFQTWVEPGALAQPLCGARRPGHFRGVCTVVAKLFALSRADLALFGEKDYQQLLVVRRMARDLDLGTEVVGHPIVRERDGLALSSRNAYLSPEERKRAVALWRALGEVRARFARGERDVAALEELAKRTLTEAGLRVDYAELRDPYDLERPTVAAPTTRLFLAAFVGKTRLIDNGAIGDPHRIE
jgi:pantoate--beta-alanine ligase